MLRLDNGKSSGTRAGKCTYAGGTIPGRTGTEITAGITAHLKSAHCTITSIIKIDTEARRSDNEKMRATRRLQGRWYISVTVIRRFKLTDKRCTRYSRQVRCPAIIRHYDSSALPLSRCGGFRRGNTIGSIPSSISTGGG